MRREDDLGPDDLERDHEGRGPDGTRKPRTPPRSGVTPRQILIGLLAVVLIAFAIANFEPVEVNFLLFQTRARIITVVAVAAALGLVIGYLVGRPTREERRYLRKRDD